MIISRVKSHYPLTHAIIEKQLARAHLISMVAVSVIKYTGKVFYSYSSQKKQLIPGLLIAIRAGFYFSTTLSLPLTIIAGTISLLGYSILISSARTLKNFHLHKEGWKKEFKYENDPFIKKMVSKTSLEEQAANLQTTLKSNEEKYEHQKQLAFTLPSNDAGVLEIEDYEDYQTLIREFNEFIKKAYKSHQQYQIIEHNGLALIAKYKLIFWILSKIRFNLRSTLSHHLLSYDTYKKLGGLLPLSVYPKQYLDDYQTTFLVKKIDKSTIERTEEECSFALFKAIFIDDIDNLRLAIHLTNEPPLKEALELTTDPSLQKTFPSLLPRFFNAQSQFDIDSAPIDASINYIELIRHYYESLSHEESSFHYTPLNLQIKQRLQSSLFGHESGLNKILMRVMDAGSPNKEQKEELEAYYQLQEKQLRIVLTFIEKTKKEILEKYGLKKLPSDPNDPACNDNPDLTDEARNIIQIQSSFATELLRQSQVCSTGIQTCIQERLDLLGSLIFGTSNRISNIDDYLAKLVGEFRKSKVMPMIHSFHNQDVHFAGSIKVALSLFFRFPFERNFIEAFSRPSFFGYFYITSFFVKEHYNPQSISSFLTDTLTEDYTKHELFTDLLNAYLDEQALKSLKGQHDWQNAYKLLESEYNTLKLDFERHFASLKEEIKQFCQEIETNNTLAKEKKWVDKLDFFEILNLEIGSLRTYLNSLKHQIKQPLIDISSEQELAQIDKSLEEFLKSVTEFAQQLAKQKSSPLKYKLNFIVRVSKNELVESEELYRAVNFLKDPDQTLRTFLTHLQDAYKWYYRAMWIDKNTGAIKEEKKLKLIQKLLVDYQYCTEDAFR